MSTLRALVSFLTHRRLVAAAAYTLVLLSCGDPFAPEETEVVRIDATPTTLALDVGAVRPISARALDAAGATVPGVRLFWSTENPSIATVSQSGVVSGVASGSTRISVSGRGTSAIIPVTVASLPVALVRVSPSTSTIQVGTSVTLSAAALNTAGDTIRGEAITWSSANEAIATVSETGVVTGVAPGVATVSASSAGVSGSALITVQAVPVASVQLTPDSSALLIGQSVQLVATPVDSAGIPLAGRTTTWSSSAPTVATVSSTGVVIALAQGVATITATSEGRSATARITVSLVPVDAVFITPSAATTTIGQRVQLSARTLDSAGAELSGRVLQWSSDRPAVATVSGDGEVTAVAAGRAVITATAEGRSGTSVIDVTPIPVASLTVTPTATTLAVGSAAQLTATPRDAAGAPLAGRVVTWLSGAPSVASVSQNGVVTAIGVGTALILATSEGQRATVTLTVTPAPVAQVSVSPAVATLNPDSVRTFTATARDAIGNVIAGRTVTWRSSNISVATVNGAGRVTAQAAGTTRIIAEVDGIFGSADLTVSLVPVDQVTIAPDPATVMEGRTTALVATIRDSIGTVLTDRALAWSSSDVSVATVSPTGVVTGIAPGTATISAVAQGAGLGGSSPGASVPVTVTYAPVAAVSIAPAAPSVIIGAQAQLSVVLTGPPPAMPLPTAGRTLTWSVANPAVASVSSSGVVTGIAAGTTQVTVTAASPGQATPVSTSVTLTVSVVPIARIVLSSLPGTIHVGTLYARQVSAQALDAAGNVLTGRAITWTTSNTLRLTATPGATGSNVATLTALTAPASGLRVIASAPGAGGSQVADTLLVTTDLVPITSVVVAPTSGTLLPQQTQALVATARDSAGNAVGTAAGNPLGGRATTWTSANPAIGTVSAAGVVTAVAVGGTTIGATIGGAPPASFALTVIPVPVTTVEVSSPDSTITVGTTVQAAVVARDSAGNVLSLAGRTVTWSSANSSIATVSSSGVVTAIRAGNTVIGVTVDGVGPASFALGVTLPVVVPLPVASVSITAPDSSIVVGTSVQAAVEARDAVGGLLQLTGRTVVWTSRTPSVATISASGLVSTVAPGGTIIGVTVDGVGPATFALTVLPIPVVSVAVSAPDSSVTVGDAVQATVVARDAAGAVLPLAGRSVVWTTSQPAVASVSSSGVVTALGVGTTTIGVTVDGVGPASFTFTVAPRAVASVSVSAPDSSVTLGTPLQATVVARDAANTVLSLTGRAVVWSSSVPSVATVTSSGAITTVGVGTTTIGVTVDGVGPATFVLSVSAVPVATVSVTAPDSSVTLGTPLQATAVARDAANNVLALTGRTVAWSSSATGVATVSGTGAITTVGVGTTTIGVTVDGVGPATFVLTVSAVPVATVSVSAADSSIAAGATVQATAVARDAANNVLALAGRAVSWSSSATSVATVDANGLVTALAPGTTTIGVTVDGIGPATFTLDVTPASVASVSVTATDSSLFVGTTAQATVVARDAANNILPLTGRTVAWASSNSAVASVSSSGLVTALAAGNATISVTVDGVGPASFPLVVATVPVATVSVSAPDSSVTVGTPLQATAVARDAANNALSLTGRTVAWSSSATGVATVSSSGAIATVGVGSATISVTVDGVGPASFTLTVSAVPVATVSVSAPDSSIAAGATVQATAVARDAGSNVLALAGRTVAWTSSNTAVASVDATGLVTAVATGSTTIGVTVDGVGPATFTLDVTPAQVASVSVSAPDSSVTLGTPLQATVVARDAANTVLSLAGRAVVWSSSATGVATVSGTGAIITVGVGTTTIGVTVDGVGPASFVLSVSAVPVATVSVSAADSSIAAGATVQATVVARDAGSNLLALAGRTVAWTSSNTAVASVDATGLVTAVATGSTTIGVTVDGVGPATFTLDVTPAQVASVSVTATDSSLFVGTTAQATVVARDAANNVLPLTGRSVIWTTSAPGVASVSSSGLVTALAAGSATINVTVDGVGPATFVLTVSTVPVATVSVSAADSSIAAGATVQATAVARDAANNVLSLAGRAVVWSSSATSVATVDANGLVTAVAPGTTTIGVTVDGIGPAAFTLDVTPASVASVSVTATDSSLFVGTTAQATVVARDAANNVLPLTGRSVIWTTSAPGVASVSSSGLVTALAAGNATINVTVDGVGPASFPLVVATVPVATVSVSAPDSSVTVGTPLQATAVARDAANNALSLTGRTVAWSSSATGIATVNSSGAIATVGVGTTTISVTVDGVGPATFDLTVSAAPVASVTVSAPDSSIAAGATVQATAVARDAANNVLSLAGRTVVWSSSNTAVANVDGSGLVTALTTGSTTIGVTVDGVGPATFTLDVTPASVASVSVTATDSSLFVGTTAQATVVARDAANNILPLTGRSVIWTTSAPGVASVSSSGLVTALAAGNATINVTVDGVGPASFPLVVATVPVATVSVSAPDSSIAAGATVQATAVARDAANNVLSLTGRTVVWSSSNTAVASVNGSGLVTALTTGSTTIGVTVDGVGPATFTLDVTPASVASVSVTATDSSLFVGTTAQATVVARDAANNVLPLTGRSVIWTTTAPGVASVSSSGLVTALAAGNATINVTVDGVGPASFPLTVATVPVATVSVSAPDSSVTVGTPLQATAVARDAANNVLSLAGRTVTWSSSATGVATVNSSGAIATVGVGTTTIGVTVDGIGPATFDLTVSAAPVASVTVSAPDSSIAIGATVQATAVARDAANNVLPLAGRTVVWSSSDTGVATVNGSGLVTALTTGSTTIGVTVDGVGPATFTLDVTAAAVASVAVSAPDSSVTLGTPLQATAVARDAANNVLSLTGRTVVWSSSATGVATVNSSGAITTVGVGTTTIGVTVDGIGPATFDLTVSAAPVASVTVSAPDSSIAAGATVQATAVARDAANNVLSLTGRTVVWSSSNTAVANVDGSGLVTALTTGSTTIGVTVDGIGPATFTLDVTAPAVSSVTVTAPDSSITLGTPLQATVVARDAANTVLSLTGRTVVWSSSTTGVATVSGSGAITTVGVGTTTIGVTVDGIGPATFDLTVSAVPVATVSVSAPDSSIAIGATVQATAVARDAANNVLSLAGRTVAWSSSNTTVANVDGSGLVTALTTGSTTISVTVDGIGPATFTLDVTAPAVSSVTVSAPDSSITLGTPLQATAVARDAANNVLALTGRTVAWSSSATGVATVSGSGAITTVGVGTTTIGVTVDGVGPATFDLTVSPVPVATVTVSATDSSVVAGDPPVQATVVARDAANTVLSLAGRAVVWTSSNTGVATVSSAGLVSAVAPGTTTISVTVDGVGPATFDFTVAPVPVDRVDVSPTTAALLVGSTQAFTAVPRDASGNALTGRTITWSLDNAKASATPLSGGSTTLTAADSGTVTVSATSEGKTGTATVTITLVPVDSVESIPPSATPSVTLTAGSGSNSQQRFRARSATNANLAGRAFTLASSDTALATVAPVGTSSLTDNAGQGEFIVTLTAAAVAGNTIDITVTIEGKSTVWRVTVS